MSDCVEGDEITRFAHILLVVYFAEVGLVLIIAPWTTFWDRNFFVEWLPALEPLLTSHVVRGGVSGVGVLSVGVALIDVAATIVRAFSRHTSVGDDESVFADATPRS